MACLALSHPRQVRQHSHLHLHPNAYRTCTHMSCARTWYAWDMCACTRKHMPVTMCMHGCIDMAALYSCPHACVAHDRHGTCVHGTRAMGWRHVAACQALGRGHGTRSRERVTAPASKKHRSSSRFAFPLRCEVFLLALVGVLVLRVGTCYSHVSLCQALGRVSGSEVARGQGTVRRERSRRQRLGRRMPSVHRWS